MTDLLQPDDADYWLDQAEQIMGFLRHGQLVGALEHDVWFFKGNASEQLAAFLQCSSLSPVAPPDIVLTES